MNQKESIKSCIRDLPSEERPYEKCKHYGPAALTDSELLAVLLRTGSKEYGVLDLARQLLTSDSSYGINLLLYRSIEEYKSYAGIGDVKAVQLVCIGEIAKRMWRRETTGNRETFSNPSLCANYYMQELRSLEQEELRVAFLDSRMKLMSDAIISRGSVNGSMLSVREIMIEALKRKAVNIILIHNHPSGVSNPSDEDIRATKRIKDACHIIGVGMADHVIIGDNQYYSFKEWGTL